jgi:hypothetical protein
MPRCAKLQTAARIAKSELDFNAEAAKRPKGRYYVEPPLPHPSPPQKLQSFSY